MESLSSSQRLWKASPEATSVAVQLAHEQGLRHLLAHFKLFGKAGGFFHAPSASRVLESALTLHLLRRTGRDDAWQQRLEGFLRAKVGDSDLISSMAAKAVLNLPLGSDGLATMRLCAVSAEYGVRRKRALLTMLLVELGIIPFDHAGLLAGDYAAGAAHQFSRLYAAALRLIHHRYQPLSIGVSQDVAFLTSAQNENGSWEQQALITVFAMMALGPGQPAFERGFAYLRRVSREDGGIPFIDNQDTWVSCIAGLALQEIRPVGDSIQELLAEFIVSRQHKNGGWSFTESVTQTDTDVSANCAQMLLQHGDNRYSKIIERVLLYFRHLQRADGGYPTYEREGESEVTMTANILRAQSLAAAFDPSLGPAMRRAAALLIDRQRQDGSFEMSWSRSEIYSIFRVLWAVDAYQQTETDWRAPALALRSLSRLRQTQNADGGWGQSAGVASDALSTAYAIASMCLLRKQHFIEISRINQGLAYLLTQQDQQTGAFLSVPDVAGPRPIPFDTPLLGTIWSLLTLSFARRAMPES